MKKIEKKLSAPEVHLEKCLQRPSSMLCKIWAILKKLSAQPEWREKTCKCSIDGGENFPSS